MFESLHIPIAGIIENMSGFICPNCGEEYDIFGKGGTSELASKYNTNIIANIPLEPKVREGGDNGKPIVFFEPTSKSGQSYKKASEFIITFLQNVAENNLADNKHIQPVN